MPSEVVEWVRQNAVPLKTVDPAAAGEDIEAFGKMVGDARIVGLGEGTHGTSEFFRVKHRLIKYLVEKKGFTVIGFEGSFAALKPVNEYILHGRGTPEDALNSISSWVWNTEEVLELVKWLRQHNQDSKTEKKVSIYGFDVLNMIPEVYESLEYIGKHDPKSSEILKQPLIALNKFDLEKIEKNQRFDGLYSNLTQAEADRLDAAAEQIIDYFDKNRAELIKRSSVEEWEIARQHAYVAGQRAQNLVHLSRWFSTLGQNDELALRERLKIAAPALQSFFEKYDAQFAGRTRELLTTINPVNAARRRYRNNLTPTERAKWDLTAAQIAARLTVRRAQYLVSGATETELTETLKHADDLRVQLSAFREYLSKPEAWWSDPRDVSLANNAEWILRHAGAGAKMILWAHNLHISNEFDENTLGPMGRELQGRFGKYYVAVGTMFNKGAFQAQMIPAPPENDPLKRIRRFEVGAAAEDSIEDVFAKTGISQFIVDLRKIPPTGKTAEWFRARQTYRHIGNSFAPAQEASFYSQTVLPKQQDIIVFIETTTRAKPTRQSLDNFSIAPH